MKKLLLLIAAIFCITVIATAQLTDSVANKNTLSIKDSILKKEKKKFNPRTATLRSAILPGWGQLYNKKYWKAPLVWGALGTTAGIYFYNVKNYRLLKNAYNYLTDNDPTNNTLVDPDFRNLSTEAIRSYRNSFRQNVDYSVLFFILFWGLNVVDATVDAHLKSFDVDDNLSLQIKAGYSDMAKTTGVSLVLNFNKRR
jgi:hypothetical protein